MSLSWLCNHLVLQRILGVETVQGNVTIHLVFLVIVQDGVKELDPGMLQNLRDRDPLLWIHYEHSANEVLNFARQLRGD
jgi:hypothetical protein